MAGEKLKAGLVDTLKRRAKRLKKANPGTTHTEALNQVAKERGFSSWALLMKALGPALVLLLSGCPETTYETRPTTKWDRYDEKCAEIAHDCAVCWEYLDREGLDQTQPCEDCKKYDSFGCGSRPGHKNKAS